MNKKQSFILIPFLLLLLFSCHKDDDSGCLGCGIDLTPREFQFTISGDIKNNCLGDPAAMKTLDFYIFYNVSDSLAGSSHADDQGHFTFTYKKVLPGAYW